MRLIPRDEHFFLMFDQMAQKLVNVALLMKQLMDEPHRMTELVTAIKVEEEAADNLTREVIQRINTTFITPLDREDIHRLISRLDNVIDLIDGTARRAQMFRITEIREPARQLADVLVRASAAIQHGVVNIKKPKVIEAKTHELKLLEEEADAIYHLAIGELFDGATDAIDVLRWKELLDKLEDAADECEDVANVLEGISLKHL